MLFRSPDYLFYPYYDDGESVPKITDVVFADGSVCKRIGESAFELCAELVNINIPDSVNVFDRECFGGCKKLEHINFPDGTRKLASFAFKDCAKLKTVAIPSSVTELCTGVFENCRGIERITVPESLSEACGKLGVERDKVKIIKA